MPAPDLFVPGTLVGPYRLGSPLGRGGMGAVFAADGPGGRVALKLVASYGATSAERERFAREVDALRTLDHPGIVRILDRGTCARTGVPYFAMDLLDGEDLAAWVSRSGPLAEAAALSLGLDVAEALLHAHERGVVHRDVKPRNVLILRGSGRAVLCDFGLARRVDEVSSLTRTGAFLGTPTFMAPEQFLDARKADERSDVFSLAMTLVTALSAKNPLEECRSTTELMMALCTRPIPRLEELMAPRTVARSLAEALRRALSTEPDERSTMAELRRDLAASEGSSVSIPAPRTLPLGAVLGAGRPLPRLSVVARGAGVSAPPDPGPEVRPPLRLERASYTLHAEVAEGIFDGRDEDGRPVRVERLGAVATSPDGEARFRAEVDAFGSVLSESIVALLDSGIEGADAFVVTEPPVLPTLRGLVSERGTLPFGAAVTAFVGLVRGLRMLHEVGVVHGFLAPDSFHFRSSGRREILVLHELGIGARIGAALRAPTRQPPKRDPRSDVVQIVSALYLTAVGKVPFGASAVKARPPAHTTLSAPDPTGRSALDDLVRRTIEGKVPTLSGLATELSALLEAASV